VAGIALACASVAAVSLFAPRKVVAASGNGGGYEGLYIPRSQYLSPVALAVSPDGARLYVVCEDDGDLLVVDTRTEKVVGRIHLGGRPQGIALSPDGATIYVSNEKSDTVAVVDAATMKVRATLHTGWGPVGLATNRQGTVLYVANTMGDDVSLIDSATGREIKRLNAGHYPEYVKLSRDGRRIYVVNLMARLGAYDEPPESQLTVIDTEKQIVTARVSVPGVIQMRHIAQLPASTGGDLLIPFMRPKNLNPLVQIPQGWYMTHGMAVIHPAATASAGPADYKVREVLLDDIDHYYADDFGAADVPGRHLALVTASGANVVSIVDTNALRHLLLTASPERLRELPDRLDSARSFVVRRLKTGRNPTDVVVSPNGNDAYVANRMDDTISVIDLRALRVASTIDLGGPKEVSRQRRGEQLFFDARFSYEGQMACASCHPHEGLSDGLAWSLETPQLGRNVVVNRTLYGIDGTSPFKWNGMNPNLQTQDGPRTAHYIFRSQGFGQRQLEALVTYLLSLRLPRNPHLAADGKLTPAQAAGKEIFFRTRTNSGQLIPEKDRCYYCHSPHTHYTSRVLEDVGTATPYDTDPLFDVPQLEGVSLKPPYLHNGEAPELEDIWTKFNPDDKHGFTSDMDKVQLNELIEYLKTL
jgi:YVTN family beta-propeller protein